MVRGLRAVSDFETEMQLAHNNRILAPDVDTVFFMTSLEQGYVSSSLVKEIARFGGDVSGMVPPAAAAALAALAGRGEPRATAALAGAIIPADRAVKAPVSARGGPVRSTSSSSSPGCRP